MTSKSKYQSPVARDELSVHISSITKSIQLEAESQTRLLVLVSNSGISPLSSSGSFPIHLSYHWMDLENRAVVFDGLRTRLQHPLRPGESRYIAVEIVAPPNPGEYRLALTMVQEGQFWFEEALDAFPLVLAVTVLPPRAPAVTIDKTIFSRHPALASPHYLERIVHQGRARPIMIIVETSGVCTNRCLICSEGKYNGHIERPPVMPMSLFEKLLDDYAQMGGGAISLTPHPGELFLDKALFERLRLLDTYPSITALSVTTNAVPLDRYSDAELAYIVNRFKRIHVSIYGLNEEEYRQMAGRDFFKQVIANIRRILAVADDPSALGFGFRFSQRHSDDEIEEWIAATFGMKIPYGSTDKYQKWSDLLDTDAPLPGIAEWLPPGANAAQCIRPLVSLLVYANGDVSFCPCADLYKNEDLHLGSLTTSRLCDLYNSEKTAKLWDFTSSMPAFCARCNMHVSMENFDEYRWVFDNPMAFLGG